MKTLLAILLFTAVALQEAHAVPVFARKYNTTCFTCHTTPPLLNDFGLRFQANGYQLPGTLEKFAQADQPNFALGVVAQPMYMYNRTQNNLSDSTGAIPTAATSTSFSGIEVGLFSSASLGEHFSFYTGLPVAISAGQPATIDVETANLMYTDVLNDGTGSLNFRLGRFRMFIPYQHQVILANEDPLLYTYDAVGNHANLSRTNSLSFADPNFGVSAFGMIPGIAEGLKWDAGISGGTNSDIDLKTSMSYFGALNQTFYVNNAPLRVGVFYYGGSQQLTNTTDTFQGYYQYTNEMSRVGINLEFYDPWTKRLDFYGQYLTGKDAPNHTSSIDYEDSIGFTNTVTGGFGGVNVIIVPEKFYIYGRYDILNVKETNDKQHQVDLGFQYHLLPNVFLIGVYTISNDVTTDDSGVTTGDVTTTSAGIGIRFGF